MKASNLKIGDDVAFDRKDGRMWGNVVSFDEETVCVAYSYGSDIVRLGMAWLEMWQIKDHASMRRREATTTSPDSSSD
jgi:hypothetical protein